MVFRSRGIAAARLAGDDNRRRPGWLPGAVLATILAHAPDASARAVAPCDVQYPSDAKVQWKCERLDKGQTLETLFAERWEDVARFNRIDQRHARVGVAIKVPTDLAMIAGFHPLEPRYEPGREEPQSILVDLTNQFLGAYEYGELVFALPIASGRQSSPTPAGDYRITAFHRDHRSSRYDIVGTRRPYPMYWGLRFHTTSRGVMYWIHGRDLPGYPASHGCVGLYDEVMQKEVYGSPAEPRLADARRLYEWVVGDTPDPGALQEIEGPPVRIVGELPPIGIPKTSP